MQIVTKTPQHY